MASIIDELNDFRKDPNQGSASLYRNCQPKFLRWAKDYSRLQEDDLRDIFQNAVIIMLLNLESGRLTQLVGSLCTYVFGIAKNLIQAFRRKNGRTDLPGEMPNEKPGDQEITAEERLIKEQDDSRLWTLVDNLGEPCRTIIHLTYVEGMTGQEIADVLGYASADVVRQLRKRCLDRLRS